MTTLAIVAIVVFALAAPAHAAPVRAAWDRCVGHVYRVDPTNALSGVGDVHEAFRQAGRASGVSWTFGGYATRGDHRGAVFVAWTTPGGAIPAGMSGVGQPTRIGDTYTGGYVYFSAAEATTPALALHEVGHVMGLDHRGGARDVMANIAGQQSYGPRDRAALRRTSRCTVPS